MLTFNIDTSDGLSNGALGEVVGYKMSSEGRIQIIYVNFDAEKIGKDRRVSSTLKESRYRGKN